MKICSFLVNYFHLSYISSGRISSLPIAFVILVFCRCDYFIFHHKIFHFSPTIQNFSSTLHNDSIRSLGSTLSILAIFFSSSVIKIILNLHTFLISFSFFLGFILLWIECSSSNYFYFLTCLPKT